MTYFPMSTFTLPRQRKRKKKESKWISMNYDLVSVIQQYMNLTEMLCLRYTCRHFFYIFKSLFAKSYFWKVIREELFLELTSCRHFRRTPKCITSGLSRLNLSETIRIEFGENLVLSLDMIKGVRKIAPRLMEMKIYLPSLDIKEATKPTELAKVLKDVKVYFSIDTFSSRVDGNFLSSHRITCICQSGISSNLEICQDRSHSYVEKCFVLTDMDCWGCKHYNSQQSEKNKKNINRKKKKKKKPKHERKMCKFHFPYYQKCKSCSKRCCNRCYYLDEARRWMYYCQICKLYYCSDCSSGKCENETCNERICSKCGIQKCFECGANSCVECTHRFRGFNKMINHRTEGNDPFEDGNYTSRHQKNLNQSYELVLCEKCMKKKKDDINVREDKAMYNVSSDGKYVGGGRSRLNTLPPPPLKNRFGLGMDSDNDDDEDNVLRFRRYLPEVFESGWDTVNNPVFGRVEDEDEDEDDDDDDDLGMIFFDPFDGANRGIM